MLDVNDDIEKTLQDIEAIVQAFERVEKTPPPQAVKAPGSKLRSSVIIIVAKAFAEQKADESEKLS